MREGVSRAGLSCYRATAEKDAGRSISLSHFQRGGADLNNAEYDHASQGDGSERQNDNHLLAPHNFLPVVDHREYAVLSEYPASRRCPLSDAVKRVSVSAFYKSPEKF